MYGNGKWIELDKLGWCVCVADNMTCFFFFAELTSL